MSARTGLPSTSGTCTACGRETGNLARHVPACTSARQDPRAVARAVAHALPASMLGPAQRFQGEVDDLMVARLMRALDAGVEVHQGGRYGWQAPQDSPLNQRRLGGTVAEALRTGLVRALSEPVGPQIRKVYVVPAPVHLRASGGPSAPRCRRYDPPNGSPMRFRLVDEIDLVDCRTCLDDAY